MWWGGGVDCESGLGLEGLGRLQHCWISADIAHCCSASLLPTPCLSHIQEVCDNTFQYSEGTRSNYKFSQTVFTHCKLQICFYLKAGCNQQYLCQLEFSWATSWETIRVRFIKLELIATVSWKINSNIPTTSQVKTSLFIYKNARLV